MADTASRIFNKQHASGDTFHDLTKNSYIRSILKSPTHRQTLGNISVQHRAEYADLFQAARNDIDAGVVAANTQERKRYNSVNRHRTFKSGLPM
jgi:hypothetical protein